MKTRQAIALAATVPAFGATLVFGLVTAHGDAIEEDSPQWSCVDDGNRICGPNNAEGKPAACYDDGGVIVALWPCNPWVPNMGHRHADGTTTYPNGDVMDDDGDVLVVGDHSSEYIGGGLETYIRENAGYYVAVVVDGLPPEESEDDNNIGWAVAYREGVDQ